MSTGSHGKARIPIMAGAVAACCAVTIATGCKRPVVGESTSSVQASGPEIRITSATVDGTGHVVASITMTDDGKPVATAEAALALKPMFTLAALSTHPVDGLAAWKSLILNAATIASLPPGGPGTPSGLILSNVKQPGAESATALAGEDGAFTYVFATALPAGFDPAETLRVGVWLLDAGTAEATSTFDFRPAGGSPAPRDTVLPANCNRCHDAVRSPRGAVGVKMCVTCHTWQNADPDTTDPAALDGATPATDPNPLDLGRMVHRIHRGKNLPTLYAASSTAAAPTLPSASPLPLPFFPGRNAVSPGRKYSIVGPMSHEVVFGRIVTRTDNGQSPGRTLAAGVVFPRDLRDCGVCHEGAPQEYEVLFGISRRTCGGCHPEIWFQASAITDPVHFAHPGGPQADDVECAGCHVAATATQPKVYAPIAAAHLPPYKSARFSMPVVEIVSVENLAPGVAPTVKFKLFDEVGTLSPPNLPTPDLDPSPSGSPISRKLERLYITLAGPTAPDYSGIPTTSADVGNPNPLTLVADAGGVFTYTFASTLPGNATGTWSVAMEARRRAVTTLYDVATDTFLWPYTGESLTETAQNPIAYVDVSAGVWPGGAPVPRRTIVAQEKCDRCHGRIVLHGSLRNQVEYCVICHSPDRTDWGTPLGVTPIAGRPKWPAGALLAGNVNLGGTYDGLEERSIHFKVMIHRIHTGGRSSSAAGLDLIEPYVIYGYSGNPYFFDEGIFPNDLGNCTLCHEGKTYTVDAVAPDAPPTVANETPTLLHAATNAHAAGEPATPPIQAACMGCHATGSTLNHVGRYTASGVELCAQCHLSGTLGVEIAHGLARPGAAAVGATYASIAQSILVPRCASAACHGGSPPVASPRLDAEAAWAELVDRPSQQASGIDLVEPFAPERSYLVLKLRGEAATVGGVATPMPIGDAALDPSEIAAIEAWIANGAQND